MAPIASRFFAASALFASVVGGISNINTCTKQDRCIVWEMTPSIGECPAKSVTNPFNKTCPGRWKVCMTVKQNIDGNAPECPEVVVSGKCPSHRCDAGSPKWPQQTPADCHNPWLIGAGAGDANDRKYCQYGQPGDTLEFKVVDGGDCLEQGHPALATIITVNQEQCTAVVSCKPGDDDKKNCQTGCTLTARPCVHHFVVPSTCACTDTTNSSSATSSSTTSASPPTTPSTTPQKPGPTTPRPKPGGNGFESMPSNPQGSLSLLAESKVSGLASPAVLVVGVALAVATFAAAVVAMARRGAAGAGAVQATGEVEEAFLPEQLEG